MKNSELSFFERLKTTEAVQPTAPSEGSAMEQELKKADPEFSVPLTLRNLFTHHDAHPIVLDIALLKSFGVEWFTWEPETLWAEISRTFSTQISELTRAKIMVLKTLHISPAAWTSWHVFEKTVQGLNNNIPRFDIMQAPSLEQLYAAVDMLDSLRHEEYSDEVKLYMAAVVLNENVFYAAEPLEFIQPEVSQPYFECLDCGNCDSALFHDGYCDTCTHKFEPENGLSMRPSAEALAAGRGKNLKLHLKFDPTDTERRWKEVEHLPTDKVDLHDESVADVQVARLLVARDYMNIRRRQMAEQLTALKSWLGV